MTLSLVATPNAAHLEPVSTAVRQSVVPREDASAMLLAKRIQAPRQLAISRVESALVSDVFPVTGSPWPSPVSQAFAPLLRTMLGEAPPVRLQFWDRSAIGRTDGAGTIEVRSPDAIRRLVWASGELGLARAFVLGEIDVVGDLLATLKVL